MFLFGTCLLYWKSQRVKRKQVIRKRREKKIKEKILDSGCFSLLLYQPLFSSVWQVIKKEENARNEQYWDHQPATKKWKKIFLIIAIWKEWSRKMRIKRWNDVEIFSNYNSRIQSRPFSGNEEKWIRILIAGKVCRIF